MKKDRPGQHVWATPPMMVSIREIQAHLKEIRGVEYPRPLILAEALAVYRKHIGLDTDRVLSVSPGAEDYMTQEER